MREINRRTVLRGIGATLALPWLEVMQTGLVRTAIGAEMNAYTPFAADGQPKRLAFMYIPNGVIGNKFFPTTVGENFEITPTLEPLKQLREDISIFTGLNRTYFAGEPHAQAGSCWLTSAAPDALADGSTAIDMTLDQLIARAVGNETPFSSIELSCNRFVDKIEPKTYDSISWYGPGNDAKSQNDPRQVFKRLFGDTKGIKSSVLDVVLDDANSLRKELGHQDKHKLDEYLNSVRSIERRLERQKASKGKLKNLDYAMPAELPVNRGDYIRLMGDMMVLAFQTDQTRIATLMVGPERWQTPQMYDDVFDKPVDHHIMTHDPLYDEQVAKIDHFHIAQYAYLINKLKSTREGAGSLLDHCCFVLGSGLGNGAEHSYEELPLIIAGNGGGELKPGRHVRSAEGTRLANLWRSIAKWMGVEMNEFADSTGELKGFID